MSPSMFPPPFDFGKKGRERGAPDFPKLVEFPRTVVNPFSFQTLSSPFQLLVPRHLVV